MVSEPADDYLCVGICMPDPDSGYCLGCGRPPLPVSPCTQGIVVVEERRDTRVPDEQPDGGGKRQR